MVSLQTSFKRLFLLFSIGFLFILYYTLNKKSFTSPNEGYRYSYYGKNGLLRTNENATSSTIRLIPMPKFIRHEQSVINLASNAFRIVSKQNISNDLQLAINRFSKYISLRTTNAFSIEQVSNTVEGVMVIDCPSILSEQGNYPKLGEDESYTLNVTKSGIYLHAASFAGVLRGLATFVQLIEQDPSSRTAYVPLVSIADQPRFPWRGLMLDVCRHWLPVSVVERTLNIMELCKLNVLHLHLSDDQGFRVQSIQHPRLHDRTNYFTHKDIRRIVEFARQRRIRIVPEFDIPGHTTSWFVGYPELATEPGTYQLETKWGMFKPTMDPTKESTYTFLDLFFKEITELFPDPYFHIGGDEVEGSQWAMSPAIQNFITQNQLKGKNGLQAYFNRRIQTMLKNYKKTLIGWEEILDEMSEQLAMDKDAVIQSWKSRESLVRTVKKGYSGILSHGYYLDHLYTSAFYHQVNPILDQEAQLLSAEERTRILGGEACMWAEFVSENNVDSRLWPRTLAVAERFWSSSLMANQTTLYERLFRMNYILDKIDLGLTHLSLYKDRLENLIADPRKKTSLLHPLVILADASEPLGLNDRVPAGIYDSTVPLTTFVDALQTESEFVWRLENLPINDQQLHEIFLMWSVNHVHLKGLFNPLDAIRNLKLWGQDLRKLSKNLARVGQIGLDILYYKANKVYHPNKNDSMNSWPLSHWIGYHSSILNGLEVDVREVRLAAVRSVRRLLKSIPLST